MADCFDRFITTPQVGAKIGTVCTNYNLSGDDW